MGKGGGGGGTTTVQKADPWSGVIPYLIGAKDENGVNDGMGIFQQAQKLYQGQGWNNKMTLANQQQINNVKGRTSDVAAYDDMNAALQAGTYDPNVQQVGNISGSSAAFDPIAGVNAVSNISGPQSVMAMLTSPTGARATQGGLDPSSALGQLLSGNVSNPYLDQQASAITGQLTRNLQENVLPGIGQSATAAGQYGGSRQGIAEGLAMSRMNQDLAPALSQLYGNAYESAQQRMYGTAQALNEQAVANAQANANRDLTAQTTNSANDLNAQQFNANLGLQNNAQALDAQKFNASGLFDASKYNATNDLNTQQFNANLGLQNNQQAMQLSQQQLANRLQGLNLMGAANQLQDQNYAQQMGLLDAKNQYNWNNLNRYASIVQPGSGIGGTQQTTAPNNSNPMAGAFGGALAGAQLGGLLGIGSGWGAGLGALAMLSDRRMKTDITRVGTLDNGLGVYRYRYKSGGPVQLGVMADEVKVVNPSAVITIDGIDYVNYGGI